MLKSISNSSTPAYVQQLQQALHKRQEQVLIRRKEVERLTALSRSRIYALMAVGDFPKPAARLGSMSVAWLLSDVDSWISNRIADRAGK